MEICTRLIVTWKFLWGEQVFTWKHLQVGVKTNIFKWPSVIQSIRHFFMLGCTWRLCAFQLYIVNPGVLLFFTLDRLESYWDFFTGLLPTDDLKNIFDPGDFFSWLYFVEMQNILQFYSFIQRLHSLISFYLNSNVINSLFYFMLKSSLQINFIVISDLIFHSYTKEIVKNIFKLLLP